MVSNLFVENHLLLLPGINNNGVAAERPRVLFFAGHFPLPRPETVVRDVTTPVPSELLKEQLKSHGLAWGVTIAEDVSFSTVVGHRFMRHDAKPDLIMTKSV
jgi:hypothetical protein